MPFKAAVSAVLVHVPDVEAALAWYERAFPAAIRCRVEDSNVDSLAIDGVQLEIVPADEKVAAGAAGSVTYWRVAEFDAALAHMQNVGARLYRGSMDIECGQRMCQVLDPWGNCIGLRGPRTSRGTGKEFNVSPHEMTDIQYQLIASRRQNHDTMLWQTPVISLTAQAFLFTIALGTGSIPGRVLASLLALISALASLHLLAKQRHLELHYSRLLEAHERAKGLPPLHHPPPKAAGALGWSAYTVWKYVFGIFGAAAIAAIVAAAYESSSSGAASSKRPDGVGPAAERKQ